MSFGLILGLRAAFADTKPPGDRGKALETLRKALADAKAGSIGASEKYSLYAKAGEEAIELLGKESVTAESLRSAMEQTAPLKDTEPKKVNDLLKIAIVEASKDLSFEPIREAEMPKGFPEPTPVGQIEVKEYPAYRLARTETGSDAAFWTLFNHIHNKNIAMSAPVQMDYTGTDTKKPQEKQMAFLYGNPTQGKTGADGKVEVLDTPPLTVVSLGVRGLREDDRIVSAKERLETWIKAHQDQYAADGEMRGMGYNSPFIPSDKQYFEVQIPLRKMGKEK
jgi:hypothetical protein